MIKLICVLIVFFNFCTNFVKIPLRIEENVVNCNKEIIFVEGEDMEIIDIVKKAKSINVYYDDYMEHFKKGDGRFEQVMLKFLNIINGGREMPALGVAINEETILAMRKGMWIEIMFGKVITHNGMKFEALVAKIEEHMGGMNIIRRYRDRYEGRCFYLDLPAEDSNLEPIVDF